MPRRTTRFRGPAVAAALRTLIDSPEVMGHCREVAARFADDTRPFERACDELEALALARAAPAAAPALPSGA